MISSNESRESCQTHCQIDWLRTLLCTTNLASIHDSCGPNSDHAHRCKDRA